MSVKFLGETISKDQGGKGRGGEVGQKIAIYLGVDPSIAPAVKSPGEKHWRFAKRILLCIRVYVEENLVEPSWGSSDFFKRLPIENMLVVFDQWHSLAKPLWFGFESGPLMPVLKAIMRVDKDIPEEEDRTKSSVLASW